MKRFLLPFLLLVSTPAPALQDPFPKDDKEERQGKVLYVPVEGEISAESAARIERDVSSWLEREREIEFIVFELDVPLGRDDEAARSLAEFIFHKLKGRRTVAFVRPGARATAQGALVALAADEIVMGPGSLLGAAGPDEAAGRLVGWDEAAKERQAEIRDWFAGYAAARGDRRIVTDAFVSGDHDDILRLPAGSGRGAGPDFKGRREFEVLPPEVKTPLRARGEPEVILQRGSLLVMDEVKAREYGFSRQVAEDRNMLQQKLGILVGPEDVIDVKHGVGRPRNPTGQAFIDLCNQPLVRLILLLGGCLGILLELKMLGTLVPGLAGLACFAIFFVTSLLPAFGNAAGTATLWEVMLFVIGMVLVAIELFFPGFAVFALTGCALCVVGIVLAMIPGDGAAVSETMNVEDAITTLVLGFGAGTIAFLLLLRFLPRSGFLKGKGLVSHESIVGVPTADSALEAQAEVTRLLGRSGVALTALRPAGKVKLDDGQLIDVVAEGEFIEKGNSVRVADCAGGRVVVRRETPA